MLYFHGENCYGVVLKEKIVPAKKKFDYPTVLTLSLSHMVSDMYAAFLAPVLPLLISGLGITKFQAGLLDFARKAPTVLNPLFGMIADRIDAKYFLILGCVIITVSMSLLGAVNDYSSLLILVVVAGIGTSIYHVPGPVIIKKVVPDKLGTGMSYYMLGGEFARTLGPLMILSAVSLWSFEGSWRVMPVGLAVSLFLYFRIRKIKVHSRHSGEKSGFKEYRKYTGFFLILLCMMFFRSAMHSSLTLFLPTYLTHKGHSLWFAGISLSLLQFAGAAGTLAIGSLSDKIGRKNTLIAISVLNPIMMFSFLYLPEIFILPVLIVSGFILFGSNPIILALVQERDTKNLSFLNGTYMSINFAGSSVMVLVIGYLSDLWGLDKAFHTAGFLSVLAIPFVLMLKEKKT